MKGVNKVILVGNLGRDPEVQYLESGTALAKFSLATNESYNDKNGNRVDQTEWHDIVLWRKQAEIAEKFLRKGSQIYLEGKLRTRSWEDNGVKKYRTEVVGDSFIMLDKRDDAPGGGGMQAAPSYQEAPAPASSNQAQEVNQQSYEDDLPF